MFESIGPGELLLILIIALVFFGPSRLPELGRSLGDAIREFRHALRGGEAADPPAQPAPSAEDPERGRAGAGQR